MKHRESCRSRIGKKVLLGLSSLFFVVLVLFAGSSVYAQGQYISAEGLAGETMQQAAAARAACLTAGPLAATCPPESYQAILETNTKWFISPTFRVALIQAVLKTAEFVSNRLAYEAAVAISSGGPGEESLFYQQSPVDAFKSFGLLTASAAISNLDDLVNSELGTTFSLCAPSDPLILALKLGIQQKYNPEKPKCDILEVGKNWETFSATIYQTYLDPEGRQEAILKKFAETLKPGNNELTAVLRINLAVNQHVNEQRALKLQGLLKSDYKPITDFITGGIETPSSTLQKDFEKKLENAGGEGSRLMPGDLLSAGDLIGGLALSTASTFTNTLLSQLLNRIYTGLFTSDIPDEFDIEAVAGGGRSAAQERFASIMTTNPIVTTEYDALSEFVVCTAEGVTNRGLYNCVMDVNFMAAVSRGTAGLPLTVQEAIDEGLLNGDWPLIPPENEPANQDSFCYTYGYCYGNLVKLRKARVVPIGWELAALRNSESNPATLQEVIDGFNNCTQGGTIGPQSASDSDSRWCHLIDPNWVLKYPETACRSIGTGEIRLSSLSASRQSSCVDAPSCIGEDNNGDCVDGYGYCVQEKNVWRFRGDECPEEYATCLSFTNTETGDDGDFLVSTVDYSVCDQDNAGCRWYRTDKYVEDAGTEDPGDDSYEWLAEGDDYVVEERDDDWSYPIRSSATGRVTAASRETYSYTSDSGETYSYTSFAYEDRLYLTNDATECSEDSVGCTQLYEFDDSLYLNTVRNPSFEDDEDSDGTPDGWVPTDETAIFSLDTSTSEFGSTSLALTPSRTTYLYQDISVSEQNFYTLSAYAKAETSGDSTQILLQFLDEDGDLLSGEGLSSSGDCVWSGFISAYQIIEEPGTDDFDRFECLVTAPEGTVHIRVGLMNLSESDDVYYDAVQLELGEDASTFVNGYSGTPRALYYQIAPDYLGCTGAATDPVECDSYAQVCSAQEVGCSLYTPEDGDPNVPAIISELDECPSECVGYTTYKQEATDYESEEFPLYFIADSASSCAQQYVGCDSYTNLGTVEAGGEGIEYYTNLRFCLSNEIADATSANKTPATYFTWEGSDNEGYQLQTWNLLQSDYSGAIDTFVNSGFEETDPELAPCTHVQMSSENEVVCRDSTAVLLAEVWENDACDEHDDIFDNPDCREFFDTEGNIHYRQYSDTVSISDECAAYRKDAGEETDCDESGGYWTDGGFCRYYVLPQESTECPAEQNGCREYTGGTGRNSTTILNETFEGGTYENFVMADIASYPDEISISNESVATEGHSLYVLAPSSGMAGIETTQIYLGPTPTDTYDEDDGATCTGTEGASGCEITNDVDGDGSDDEDCTVTDGQESCGVLTSGLVAGKTFVLDFWAKGNGNLYVTFEEEGGAGTVHDFVDPDATISSVSDLTPIALDGAWALYSLGPVDTSSYEDFDENAVIRFATNAGMEFYLDNVTLKQTEENITLIKDSWVVPSTCDQTPEGVDSDQYYLGCEAYSDHNGNDVDLYQFSDLCSEEVVGCEGFYDTANSESAYQKVYNARCVWSEFADFTSDVGIASNASCTIDGVTYCTISAGRSYCTFDTDTVFSHPLPISQPSLGGYFGIVYGPETVITAGDTPVYLVENDNFACASSAMGCQELGEPTYVQDQSEVESFESVYYINLPGDYDNILCSNEALFCEEWASTQDGNFYFKDPIDKECEYKTSVTIDNRSYFGWFRTGTTEPCYWTDEDGDGAFDYGEEEAYLIAGEEFGVWRNGDEDDDDDDTWDYYDGWVASCDGKYDLCTEFIDVVDTGGGLNEDGQSYYFTNDDLLSEDTLQDSQRCNGLVSQKFGCALFNNTTISELTYNAGASYILSTHADVFYGTQMNDLVDPISCTTQDGGVFEVSSASAAEAGTGTEVDLCARRCEYTLESGDSLTTTSSTISAVHDTTYYNTSCFIDSDCANLTTSNGEEVTGTCTDVSPRYTLNNDTNEVLKVTRDRSCSAWLACESSRTSWNTSSNKYDTICDSINLCRDGVNLGDQSTCTLWEERDPEILSDFVYSARDVTWSGYDYSGMSIPNQLPVELYNQFNIQPSKLCLNVLGTYQIPNISCNSALDCGTTGDSFCTSNSACASGLCDTSSGTCYLTCTDDVDPDYRLVYNAGTCDSDETSGVGRGGECVVGFCEDSPEDSCRADDECGDGECVVGYCQATSDTACNPDDNEEDGTNTACEGSTAGASAFIGDRSPVSTPVCDPIQFTCVSALTGGTGNSCVTTDDCGTFAERENYDCVSASSSIVGSCFNNSCLVDVVDEDGDQRPDSIGISDLRGSVCRSYPEIDSPFPYQVVSGWKQVGTAVDSSTGLPMVSSSTILTSDEDLIYPWSVPYNYVSGYQDSKVCGPTDDNEANNDCLCSYDKVTYENSMQYRYYEFGSVLDSPVMEGICTSGSKANFPCSDDSECDTGTCALVSRVDSMYGWPGYCIEKDSSIQINGSSDTDDQACLSWLPIDQLAGATDLYGKSMEAGYPLEDTYFCSETAIYYDLYPTGSKINEGGSLENPMLACADSGDYTSVSCDYGDYGKDGDRCIENVACPHNYVAILATCDAGWLAGDEDDSFCDNSVLNNYKAEHPDYDDCPYFCVHEDSKFIDVNEDVEASLIGTSCVEALDNCYESVVTSTSTQVFLAGGLHAGTGADACDIVDVSATVPGSGDRVFKYCVTRGVSQWYDSTTGPLDVLNSSYSFEVVDDDSFNLAGYRSGSNYEFSHMAVGPMITYGIGRCSSSGEVCFEDSDCDSSDTCEMVEKDDGRGSAMPYLGCAEIVQVATVDPDVGNKAWTNRLWTRSGYETEDRSDFSYESGLYPFAYSASDEPQTAGRLLFGEVYSQEGDTWVISDFREDSFPAPVQGTRTDILNIYWGTGIMTAPEDYRTDKGFSIWSYPGDPQWMLGDEPVLPEGVSDPAWLGLPYEKLRAVDGTHELLEDTSTEALIDEFGNSTSSEPKSVRELLSQLFAKVYRYWRYDETAEAGDGQGGGYIEYSGWSPFDISSGEDDLSGTDIDGFGDTSALEFPDEEDRAPKLYSVGSCIGTNCYEDSEGKFTVNEIDNGTIEGETYKSVYLNFYVAAAPNQLPLKNLIVDWGDAFTFNASKKPDWPTDSQSGSTASDNFYKNHRGMNATSEDYCGLDDEWGRTSDTCSSSYVSFSHSYSCSESRLSSLDGRRCRLGDRGQLLNAPCTGGEVTGGSGACVFQPRVHAVDNWGWCTGFCDSNPEGGDDSDACYADECNVDVCPSGGYAGYGSCPDSLGSSVSDPWVYFDGYIIVTP